MVFLKLQNINKLYFGYEDIATVLGISLQSARVSANRYVKQGLLFRIKRNIYILKDKWKNLNQNEIFIIANLIQSPSYISLLTALCYYDISTQMQQNFIESIALKRTKQVEIDNTEFNFTLISKKYYSGFVKQDNFFIALPEKALLDALYLYSLKRYSIDFSALNFERLNKDVFKDLIQLYPMKTKQIFQEKYERI